TFGLYGETAPLMSLIFCNLPVGPNSIRPTSPTVNVAGAPTPADIQLHFQLLIFPKLPQLISKVYTVGFPQL
ncbi:hypothetical protein, partial [Bacillus cereus]